MSGGFSYANDTFPYVIDYFKRQRLAKLGYTCDVETLDAYSADMYLAVDLAHGEVQAEKAGKR